MQACQAIDLAVHWWDFQQVRDELLNLFLHVNWLLKVNIGQLKDHGVRKGIELDCTLPFEFLVEVWVFGFIFLDELDELYSGSFSLLEIELVVKVFAIDFEVVVVFLLSLDFALGFDLFKDEMPEKWVFGEGLFEL